MKDGETKVDSAEYIKALKKSLIPFLEGLDDYTEGSAFTLMQVRSTQLCYIANVHSFMCAVRWLDLRIIATTFWSVLTREGISREGYFSSPEFTGSAETHEGA